MNGDRVIRIVATLTLWLAPLPAAFFVGRSVYYHLIFTWHLWIGAVPALAAAVISGGMIELVGILSAHTALATGRWNRRGDVKRTDKRNRERAPFALAVGCFGVYVLAAIALAVVLEAFPFLAVWAPALFTVMAAAAYVSIGVYEQHRDRLRRYRLGWDWTMMPDDSNDDANNPNNNAEQVNDDPNDAPYRWECPEHGCGFVATTRHQRAGHGNAHRKGE